MQTLNDKPFSSRTVFAVMAIVIISVLVISMFVMAPTVLAEDPKNLTGTAGEVGKNVAKGITDITATIKAIVNPIAAAAAVICGIFLLVGSDPASLKKVKTWLISIAGGLILINVADKLVTWASGLAK